MKEGRSSIIIERLVDMIENGQSATFSSGKVAVNKDEALTLLKELESIVAGELKIYREVNDRKGRIINEAKKEAEDIIYEAEQTASRIRVTKRVNNFGSGFRADDLNSEEKLALRTAHDIYAASVIYTDEMLTEVTDVVAEAYDIINNQYGKMVNVLEEKARLIENNKAELMAGLRELTKEDRYSQIMELSQLLANELYDEKMRQRELEEFEARQLEVQPENDGVAAADEGVNMQEVATNRKKESAGALASEEYENMEKFEVPEDYEAKSDSAFEVPENYAAESDSAFEVPENYESETDSAFINAVDQALAEKLTEKQQDDKVYKQKNEQTYVRTEVEKRILKTHEVKDTDADGVSVLRPVNRFKGKKDPVANTLNMFKRNSVNSSKDGEK